MFFDILHYEGTLTVYFFHWEIRTGPIAEEFNSLFRKIWFRIMSNIPFGIIETFHNEDISLFEHFVPQTALGIIEDGNKILCHNTINLNFAYSLMDFRPTPDYFLLCFFQCWHIICYIRTCFFWWVLSLLIKRLIVWPSKGVNSPRSISSPNSSNSFPSYIIFVTASIL